MVRNELKIKEKAMPEEKLQSLWKTLDEDSSGFISAGEFGHFMKKGLGHQDAGMTSQASARAASEVAAKKKLAMAHEHALRLHKLNEEQRLLQATRKAQSAAKLLEQEATRLEAHLERRAKTVGVGKRGVGIVYTAPTGRMNASQFVDSSLMRGA